MTKRNHSSASVSREASDVTSTTVVTTSTTYTASTTVSTTTTVISPVAAATANASWNKPDINDHLSADERKRLSDSMEKREWLMKRPVSPLLRRKIYQNYLIYKKKKKDFRLKKFYLFSLY
jgi:hypothetical protein